MRCRFAALLVVLLVTPAAEVPRNHKVERAELQFRLGRREGDDALVTATLEGGRPRPRASHP
jgi:hypothetical protein